MRHVLRFLVLGLGLIGLAGCPSSCNPTESSNNSGGGPAATATPTPVTILSEAYPSGIGNWVVAGANITGVNNAGTGHTAPGCLEVSSPGYNATTSDHVRNDFTTAMTAVTTSFSIDYTLLAGLTNTVEIRLELDGQSMWRFKIVNNGASFLFNGNTLSCTPYCPTPLAWHRIVVKSSGTTTLSITIDGYPMSGFTALNTLTAADDSFDKVHLEMSEALNQSGKVFRLDDLLITTP
jgi:hypothetical protein